MMKFFLKEKFTQTFVCNFVSTRSMTFEKFLERKINNFELVQFNGNKKNMV